LDKYALLYRSFPKDKSSKKEKKMANEIVSLLHLGLCRENNGSIFLRSIL